MTVKLGATHIVKNATVIASYPKATLGYDDYTVGGDSGRIAVGTGTENIYIAKKEEVDQVANDALAMSVALS